MPKEPGRIARRRSADSGVGVRAMATKQVGKYTVVEKVGEGAMGEVYKAHDPTLHRYVAIKTINQANDADPDHRKRFLREARSAAQLIHPNIVTVFDFGEDQGRFYMAMELLEGADLKNMIRKSNPLPLSEKLRIMEQICEGVGHAHAKGIVHRDLKPGNVHVQPDGQVKILDFGLARVASSDITKTGLVMGTPNYMSPEQVQAQDVDSRSDVFSLGAVFYELLSNHKPFEADSMHATLYKVAQAEREPITKYTPNLPFPIIRILDTALSKDPGERQQNAYELLGALREIRERLGSALDADDIWGADQMETMVETPPPRNSKEASPKSQMSAPAVPPPQVTPSLEPVSKGTLRPAQFSASRSWVTYVGAAVALVAVVGLGYYYFSSQQAQEVGGGAGDEGASVLAETMATSRIEGAQQSLEAKEFESAIAIAEDILESEPNHEEALRIRNEAQGTLDQLSDALEEAGALMASGQAKPAARALAVALAIDPSHPRATDLSNRLSGQFRQEAEKAQRDAEQSRQAAATAGASSLGNFKQGSQLLSQGNEQFERQEFALATQKFLGSRDFFERARNEKGQTVARRARTEAEGRAQWQRTEERWKQLRAETSSDDVARQPAYQSALSLEDEAMQLATQGRYTEAAGAYQQAMNQILEAKEQALSEREARQAEAARKAQIAESLPPPTPEPELETTPPSTGSIPQEELDANAIRAVISTWVRAIETEDIALYRRAKPNLSGEDEGRLRASFKAVESHQVEISVRSIDVQGARATVRIMRSDTIVANGSRHSNQLEQTLTFSKESGEWTILNIGS